MNKDSASPAPSHADATPGARDWVVILIMAIGAVVAYAAIPSVFREKTDDAYVEAHVATVTAKVGAYVKALYVDDNSRVSRGELLLELDPRDFVAEVDIAKSELDVAEAKASEAQVQIRLADHRVRAARAQSKVTQANLVLAKSTLNRVRAVTDSRAVSAERSDEAIAEAARESASAHVADIDIASADVQGVLARAELRAAQASVTRAQAQLKQAEINLSYTKIYATDDGTVANKQVETGNFVQPGQVLLSLVPAQVYVIANFKETQLHRMRAGQSAQIYVDSHPELEVKAHVDSIQRGTGSRFALLPPENATGNFVKIVQRIPVKLLIDSPTDSMGLLAPGMSVEVAVFVKERPSSAKPPLGP